MAETPDIQSEESAQMWRCTYWYPNNAGTGDDPSEYQMKRYHDGETIVFESVPNAEGSYMLVRLTSMDDIATGNWHETASPTGEFKGALYSGAGQLMIDPETQAMDGQWAGAGYDHELEKMRIYSGKWEIVPIKE
jgi:hypothetical protein